MLRYTYIVCLLCYCIRQHKKSVTYLQLRRNNRGNALLVVSDRWVEACRNMYWNSDTLESNRFFHTATLREIPAILNFHFVLVAFLHTIRGEFRRFREQWQISWGSSGTQTTSLNSFICLIFSPRFERNKYQKSAPAALITSRLSVDRGNWSSSSLDSRCSSAGSFCCSWRHF